MFRKLYIDGVVFSIVNFLLRIGKQGLSTADGIYAWGYEIMVQIRILV